MNTQESTTVVAVFDSRLEANQAIASLREAGFGEHELGFAARHTDSPANGENGEEQMDTTSGAMAGALAGTGLGAVAGIGVLTGVIPIVGPAIAAGTLGVILSNAIAGAGIAGLIGALVGSGVPAPEATYYQRQLEAGRVIVSVCAGDRFETAQEILLDNGGHYVRSEDEIGNGM